MYQKVWASCKMSFCLLRLHVRSHRNEQIFQWLKNLTQYFVHTEPFDLFALFTRTDEQSWILTFVSGLTICSWAMRYCSKSKMASPSYVSMQPRLCCTKEKNNIRLWYSHRAMYDVIGLFGNFFMRFLIYDFYYIKNGNRWSIRSTEWTPADWIRIQGRPKTRWRDNLTRQIGPLWSRLAKHRHL